MKEQLHSLGLTKGETTVYLALLELGTSTTGPIIEHSKVSPSNIYEILGRLEEKGLASHVIKSKTKHYQPTPPNRLGEFINKKKAQLEKEQEILNNIKPKLESIYRQATTQPEAEVFIGARGLKAAYEKLYEKAEGKESQFFYVQSTKHDPWVDDFFMDLDEMYRKKNISLRGIADHKYDSEHTKQAEYLQMRYVDFPTPNSLDLFEDRVLILSWEAPMAVLIRSKEIASNFLKLFENIWEESSRKRKTERTT